MFRDVFLRSDQVPLISYDSLHESLPGGVYGDGLGDPPFSRLPEHGPVCVLDRVHGYDHGGDVLQ